MNGNRVGATESLLLALGYGVQASRQQLRESVVDLARIDALGSHSAAAPDHSLGTSVHGVRLDPRVIVASGPEVVGRLERHREFYLKPRQCLLPAEGVIPYRFQLDPLSYRGQLGLLLEPTDRHTPAAAILDRVRSVVLAAEVVSIARLEVGWEGTMWHVRYGEGAAFDGSCPIGPSMATVSGPEELDDLVLVDEWGTFAPDLGAVADFLAYVNRWLLLGPDVLVLAGAGHGPRLELQGLNPVAVFDDREPRVRRGEHVRVDGGPLGRIDAFVGAEGAA